MGEKTHHLRINNKEGRLVGVLDVPESNIPEEDLKSFVEKLQVTTQERFSIPIQVDFSPILKE